MTHSSWSARLNHSYLIGKTVLGTHFLGLRRISMRQVLRALLASTFIIVPVSSNAAFIDSATGLASPVTTVTFSEVSLTAGSLVTDQFSTLGVEFGSLSPNVGLYYTNGGNPGAGLQNYFPDDYNPFVISFDTAITEAAFMMVTNGYTDTFRALLNGTVVETATRTTGNWRYYGFSGIVFDEIQIGVALGESSIPSNAHMRLDNIQTGATASAPAPTTLALLLPPALLLSVRLRHHRG